MALKQVEALYGPYAGAIISIEEADADAAISSGWARDPYDPKNAPPVDLAGQTQKTENVDVEKATKDAEEYAAKLRGETDDEAQKRTKAATSRTTESRTSTAGSQTANYQTRESKADSSKGKTAEE